MLAAVAPCFQGCSNNDDPQQLEGLFLGPYDEIVLGEEGKSLPQGRILIAIKAEDGTVFEREAHHNRDALSYVRLSEGLRAGTYRLLYAIPLTPRHIQAMKPVVKNMVSAVAYMSQIQALQ